jgi:hypothetical protein
MAHATVFNRDHQQLVHVVFKIRPLDAHHSVAHFYFFSLT